ncbi:unnamed protein product [Chondrus crispus]|uniref:Uncharacterized protein n=1 Tax=Chondrus crispus TaxID=2769 RepID=R7QCD8_CHOCR|nr:unnamed protein product [Chondrus crispus]CDF36172.1 unnamed protein product [Chondrus crispus]|eukprot:XP_005715991.1 unnamed protein product [Chondrus crispus]
MTGLPATGGRRRWAGGGGGRARARGGDGRMASRGWWHDARWRGALAERTRCVCFAAVREGGSRRRRWKEGWRGRGWCERERGRDEDSGARGVSLVRVGVGSWWSEGRGVGEGRGRGRGRRGGGLVFLRLLFLYGERS